MSATETPVDPHALRDEVRHKYREVALQPDAEHHFHTGRRLAAHLGYPQEWTAELPDRTVESFAGIANPFALRQLEPGERVVDVGSGAGFDSFIAARQVGDDGQVVGVDMTDEMLEEARANAREAGVDNVEFLRGEIEDLPLPDASVDVVISNCVINLSTDKPRVLEEAHRVLRPGGRFAVADVVVRGPVPEPLRRSMELWVGCVAGALEEDEYRRLLGEAGFESVEIEPTRVYDPSDAEGFLRDAGIDPDELGSEFEESFMSAFVRARKPTARGREARP